MMRQRIIIAAAFACLCAALPLAAARPRSTHGSTQAATVPSRRFEFMYLVHVPAIPADGHALRIWIPLPQTSPHQQIRDVRIASPVRYNTYESSDGNRFAYFRVDAGRTGHAPFDIQITFDARRDEYKVALPVGDPPASSSFPPNVARYLLPDHLVPINGIIGELSSEQTAGISDPLQKARKIYEYVIAHMHYDHDGTGWGHGDAIFACTAHHGNCTDFHSLFIGMARAAGIPARFDIGFAIPSAQREGRLSSYHCWAEFYIQDVGWIPIDAAQGWQNPAKHDYFFGALDENRVRFTRGRDLTLSPRQAGDAVNYIVYPYAELDGKVFSGITQEFSFRDSHL
ncbi:MAG TPA: transglutaminase domain-containing protein [Candidatus Acidoferrales bacterium]|nr:transglutaminase domain-containing protein [Candidatus Acidoferrales bacterium]